MPYDKKTITPVTLKQLASAVPGSIGDPYTIDNYTLHVVKIVGRIVRTAGDETKKVFDIDDGTGVVTLEVYSDRTEQWATKYGELS